MAWVAGALALGSAVIGSRAGKKGSSQSTRPDLPPEIEDAFLDQLIPQAQSVFETPRPLQPFERVQAPTSVFDSPELFKLQQASDRAGGLTFNKLRGKEKDGEVQPLSPLTVEQLRNELQGRQLSGGGQAGVGTPFGGSPFRLGRMPFVGGFHPGGVMPTTTEDFQFIGAQQGLTPTQLFAIREGDHRTALKAFEGIDLSKVTAPALDRDFLGI